MQAAFNNAQQPDIQVISVYRCFSNTRIYVFLLHLLTAGNLDPPWQRTCLDEPAADVSGVRQIGRRHLPERRLKTRRLAKRDLQ